ncbi:TRAP transporter small permease [Psychromarinibacter sp. C21-152]|uniref:TRAP transporter small permease protein n=1 Tax=Psychromarinibacter sediminicola TaxID=3033385 RepID=A0AAE3NXV9_9RHOB|nr:TRAP transporter small permease [Psychromarinibacter sediminicola]MDF0603644.1 TRAP transporter small permease [Psychromarinibacter sediminicola]
MKTDAGRQPLLARILHMIASLALVVMMLVVVTDVVLRVFFNTPVKGAYDVVEIALLVMVFFGIGPVVARGGEILIDLIDGLVSAAVLRALRLVSAVGTLAVFLFLGWSMVGPARDAYRYGDISLELFLPVWWLWVVAFVGLAGILACTLIALVGALRGSRDDPHDYDEGAL